MNSMVVIFFQFHEIANIFMIFYAFTICNRIYHYITTSQVFLHKVFECYNLVKLIVNQIYVWIIHISKFNNKL